MVDGGFGYARANDLTHGVASNRWLKVGGFQFMGDTLRDEVLGATGFGVARPPPAAEGASQHQAAAPLEGSAQLQGDSAADRGAVPTRTTPPAESAQRAGAAPVSDPRAMTLEQLDAAIETWGGKKDSLSEMSEQMTLKIQMYQDRYQKLLTTLSSHAQELI